MSNKKKNFLEKIFGSKATAPEQPPTEEAIQAWLVQRIATQLEISPEEIDVRETFSNYGLDSRTAVSLSGELEHWLGRQLSPTLVWDYPTIEQVAKFLAGEGELDAGSDPANQVATNNPAIEGQSGG